jgi:putative photosynthetic complex assembly protein 2
MTSHAFAVAFVLATWWASTGLVLRTVWLGPSTYRTSVVAFGLLAIAGLVGLVWSSAETTATSAYVAFTCAIAIWALHEATFLFGWVTGPRKLPCPPDARGVRRFLFATAAVLHHEVALAVTAVVVVGVTWGAPNQVGASTFLVLWIMRMSAKLNVFLGVQSIAEEFVPPHLRYLLSYFRRAKLNPLMPVSLVAATLVTARLGVDAVAKDASAFDVVGRTLVATILALAAIEHVFLAIPLKDALLWRWAMRGKLATPAGPVPVLQEGAR